MPRGANSFEQYCSKQATTREQQNSPLKGCGYPAIQHRT
jgi:hypothetical protein